jgi:hypothetical protein
MDSKIRLFTTLLIVTLVSVFLSGVSILYFINSELSNDFTREYSYIFIIPAFIFMISTLFSFLFIKPKYPSKYISNTIEGFLYLFTVINFCASAFVLVMIAAFISTAIEEMQINPNPMTNVLSYVAAPSFVISILGIWVSLRSHIMLKIIRKNLQTFSYQIKNIGADE